MYAYCLVTLPLPFSVLTDETRHRDIALWPVGAGRILEQDTAIFEKTMGVNYFGVVHTVKAAVPGMVARRDGQVVIIASVMAIIGEPTVAPLSRLDAVTECDAVLDRECDTESALRQGFQGTHPTLGQSGR